MIDLETLARTFDAVFTACQPDARHDEVVIEPDDEHAQSDLRQRIRDAAAERRQP